METLVNNTKVGKLTLVPAGHALIDFELTSENDRAAYIGFLKSLRPSDDKSQMQIDMAIVAAGGTPEIPNFPGYEVFQQ